MRENCPDPVDTLLRYGNGARPDVFRITTCDVTGTRVYTRVTYLHSRFQNAYATSSSICGNTTFAPADPMCRPTPCAASIPSPGAIRLVPTSYQMEHLQVLISLTHWRKPFSPWPEWRTWMGWDCLLGQRPNPPDTLGKLGEALPEVWQNILRTFLPNLITPMPRQCVTCVNARGGQTCYW